MEKCPFCGKEPEFDGSYGGNDYYHHKCIFCDWIGIGKDWEETLKGDKDGKSTCDRKNDRESNPDRGN